MGISPQVIVFRKHIKPNGDQDGVNLTYTSPERFDPDTLEIFLSGLFLEKDLDFEILPGNQSFKILIDPNDENRLNCPPLQGEPFSINYVLC